MKWLMSKQYMNYIALQQTRQLFNTNLWSIPKNFIQTFKKLCTRHNRKNQTKINYGHRTQQSASSSAGKCKTGSKRLFFPKMFRLPTATGYLQNLFPGKVLSLILPSNSTNTDNTASVGKSSPHTLTFFHRRISFPHVC